MHATRGQHRTGLGAGLWRSHREDRGAIAMIVAILLAGGVLLGMGALVIDVGRLHAERAELQNGADAAALAVAQGCAAGMLSCDPSTVGTAANYANSNAKDGTSAVDLVCGRDSAGKLTACPASTGRMTDCPVTPATGATYVDVHTSTRETNGATLLPPSFARALIGNDGYDGTRVGACARVSWGAPRMATGLALTLSFCEWSAATANGTTYPAPPPYPPNAVPPSTAEQMLDIHNPGTCGGVPSGWNMPGDFGWLDDAGDDCRVTVDVTNIYPGSPGTAASGACKTALYDAWSTKAMIFLPVYDGFSGAGQGGEYHLKGFAAFVVTGYSLPGFKEKSWLSGKHLCKGEEKCLYGYFTQGLIRSSGELGGAPMGSTLVQLSG
jgi:Flp pilus assembly protein TadG